ncbi:DUF5675 family protein [Polaribacter sp.]|uniref:DUF5675 family protein n=1 Tax=Polaribacter sp. TaxID=1920175 RepID=UPI0025D2AFBC|nr:DUF5675 family protein [Polaribacter sp.]
MEIDVVRYNSQEDFTDGIFLINGGFQVHTLEDEQRNKKLYGETRVWAGRYLVVLRTEGGFHQRYLKKFGADFHKGMLWIKNVPKFNYVLIHIGNDDDDTDACLLVGMSNNADEKGFIGNSTTAYKKIYPQIRDAILSGEEVFINFYDSVYAV